MRISDSRCSVGTTDMVCGICGLWWVNIYLPKFRMTLDLCITLTMPMSVSGRLLGARVLVFAICCQMYAQNVLSNFGMTFDL